MLRERIVNETGRTVKLAFELDGDLLLDFLRRQTWRLRDHLHGDVRDIRIGIDGELGPGIIAIDGDEHADHRHHKALSQSITDEPLNHSAGLRL